MGRCPFHLALFFTRGVSLRLWEEQGQLAREVALYQRLQAMGVQVTFVTHGDERDLAFAERLPGIRVLCNRWGLPGRIHRPLMPLLHRRALRDVDLIKTNQIQGGDLALRAARRHRKPLIARCGYLLSKNVILEHGEDSPRARWALNLEKTVFSAADRIVITTEDIRDRIADRLPHVASRVTVIPNYVDTDMFAPSGEARADTPRLVFVGRLSPEKNLPALIEAVHGLDVDLDLIGQGPLGDELRARAAGNDRVHFRGTVPHGDLPKALRAANASVLPSHYEGHPKVLIEAMACGLPVIGTNVSGIREIIRDGETGLLCETDAASLRGAIQRVLSDADLRNRLGRAARRFAVSHYSLDKIAEREFALCREVIDQFHSR